MTDSLVKASSACLVKDMPIYDYKCESCGKEFSRTETMVEHTVKPVSCPKCDSDKVERVFSEFFAKTTRKS